MAGCGYCWRWRWTDLARNWVIPKPMFGGLMPGVFPLLLLGDKKLPVLVVAVIFVVIGAVVVGIEGLGRDSSGKLAAESREACTCTNIGNSTVESKLVPS